MCKIIMARRHSIGPQKIIIPMQFLFLSIKGTPSIPKMNLGTLHYMSQLRMETRDVFNYFCYLGPILSSKTKKTTTPFITLMSIQRSRRYSEKQVNYQK